MTHHPIAGGCAAHAKSAADLGAQQTAQGTPPAHVPGRSAPYAYGSETSKAAAASILRRMPQLRLEVYVAISAADSRGLTDEEISLTIPMDGNTVRPRRQELERDGWIVKAPFTRQTRSGKQAVVWLANEAPARDAEPAAAHTGVYPHSAGVVPVEPGRAHVAPRASEITVPGAGQNQPEPEQIDFAGLLAGLKGAP